MTTPEDAIEVLNRIHKADPTVMKPLIKFRVECNDEVADDQTVQVKMIPESGGHCEVGILGILNGIFGVRDDGKGFIAVYYDEHGNVSEFGLTLGSD